MAKQYDYINKLLLFTNPHYLIQQCRQSTFDPSSHTHIRYIATTYEFQCRTWRMCIDIFITNLHILILLIHVIFTNPHNLGHECRQSISDPSSHTYIRYIDTQYEYRCITWWICMGIFIMDLHNLILFIHVFLTNPPNLGHEYRQSISFPSSHTHTRYIDTQYECWWRIWWIYIDIFIRDLHSLILGIYVFFKNPHCLGRQCRQSISDPSSHTHIRYIDTQYECRWWTWWICMGIFIRDLHSPILLIHVYFHKSSLFRPTMSPIHLRSFIAHSYSVHGYPIWVPMKDLVDFHW